MGGTERKNSYNTNLLHLRILGPRVQRPLQPDLLDVDETRILEVLLVLVEFEQRPAGFSNRLCGILAHRHDRIVLSTAIVVARHGWQHILHLDIAARLD